MVRTCGKNEEMRSGIHFRLRFLGKGRIEVPDEDG